MTRLEALEARGDSDDPVNRAHLSDRIIPRKMETAAQRATGSFILRTSSMGGLGVQRANHSLTRKARRAIQVAAESAAVLVSAASLLEIATLVRRGRLVLSTSPDRWFDDLASLPEVRIVPVNAEIALRAGSLGTMQGDPIDRLIVATAVASETTLVSADERIRALDWVKTVW